MTPTPFRPVIAIHGGAGTMSRAQAGADREAEYHQALRAVLLPAQALLAEGGSALDAVSLAVDLLEDCPLFNAGHGAVFTHDATHELDAAVMEGATLRAGAVCCVTRIRRPARAARAVMEHSQHVLFAGRGAEDFARRHGLELVDPSYFSTDARREQLRAALAADRALLDHDGAALAGSGAPLEERGKMGTVGAVAVDAHGNVAAATSTGGMTNKQAGRVGDSPLVGAGTYADNATAAISCTGTGEMFIRLAVAHDVCARMRYAGLSLEEACRQVVHEALPRLEGRGGLVAVDRHGNVSMPFNTEGMYRGQARVGEAPHTAIFR